MKTFRASLPILIAIFLGACGSPTGTDITVHTGAAFVVISGILSESDANYKSSHELRPGWEFEIENRDLQMFNARIRVPGGWWGNTPFYIRGDKIFLPKGYMVCAGAEFKINILYGTAK